MLPPASHYIIFTSIYTKLELKGDYKECKRIFEKETHRCYCFHFFSMRLMYVLLYENIFIGIKKIIYLYLACYDKWDGVAAQFNPVFFFE